jgi:ankyrin repeat protein
MKAAVVGSSTLIRDLVALGAKIEEEDYLCLGMAVAYRNVEAIQTLLELGANPNANVNSNGNTLLMTAVVQKCEPAVKLLLEHGADVNTINNEGLNALELAKEMKLKKIIQILIPYCARND